MKALKNDLIMIFDNIETATMELFNGYTGISDAESVSVSAQKICSDLVDFKRAIQSFIQKSYFEKDVINRFLISSQEFRDRMKSVSEDLSTSIGKVYAALSELQEAALNGTFDDSLFTICMTQGYIARSLRFDLPATPIEESEYVKQSEITNQLAILSVVNKDYYQINPLWQSSTRRFLPHISLEDTAIVMQGPILYDDDFTIETLYRYRAIYPDTLIILSTWEGEVTAKFRYQATSAGILILESTLPDVPGPSNIKCQLKSTRAGLQAAAEYGDIRYVLKTRTDQCIFLPDFLLLMRNSHRTYRCNVPELEERLIFLGGWNSMCSFPFRLSDFMVYGALNDLQKYYSASGDSPYLEKNYVTPDAVNQHIVKWASRVMFESIDSIERMTQKEREVLNEKSRHSFDPETYICCNFYEKYILKREFAESDDNLLHYWKFLKDYAIVINADQLMIFWHKYQFQFTNWNNLVGDGGLTNSLWLSLYHSDLEL